MNNLSEYAQFCKIANMPSDDNRSYSYFIDFMSYEMKINKENIGLWFSLITGNK